MTMKVNGLLRKSQLLGKTGTAYDEYEGKWASQEKCHAPVSRSRVTLPWHAPVSRSRGTLPWHAPVSRSCGTLRWHAPVAQANVTKPETPMENTFTNGLRLKT